MSDCMTFPDTVEEFMEQYKIIDTEQVYTNGAELVPIFRMKQWFEHSPSVQPEIIRCKDCKHWARTFGDDRWSVGDCDVFDKHLVMCKGYCAWAERRTDEPDKQTD